MYRRLKRSLGKQYSRARLWSLLLASGRQFRSPAPRSGKAIERPKDITAACILDDFTYRALRDELELVPIVPEKWHDAFEGGVDMLLVEAFWRGSSGTWKGIAYDYNVRERELLRHIVRWCRRNGIPTVFWNKEDPSHFEEFIDLAAEFDHVLTTDSASVPRYRERGVDAQVMQFAAQPSLHNPIEIYPARKDKICFAGSYMRIYPQRMRDFESLADALQDIGLDIYDRNLGRGDMRYAFPEKYSGQVIGTLKGDDILEAYKGYRFGLNMNSIKGSETMLARRVFELMACNTPVISNRSVALDRTFPGLTISSDDGNEVAVKVNELRKNERAYRELRLKALRAVMRDHTYRDRVEQISEAVFGISRSQKLRSVRCVSFAEAAERSKVEVAFEAQLHPAKELTFIDLEGAVGIVRECSREGHLLALLRPRDHYGPEYLGDMVMAFRYSDAVAVTKRSRFIDHDSLKEDGHQYRWVDDLSPGAFILDPSQMGEEETCKLLLDVAGGPGKRYLSIDEFNYVESVGRDVDASFADR